MIMLFKDFKSVFKYFEQYNNNTVTESLEILLRLALKSPLTWFIPFFVLFYQGEEVSIRGWIAAFLEIYRQVGERTTGCIAFGCWSGLIFGRILFPYFHYVLLLRRLF